MKKLVMFVALLSLLLIAFDPYPGPKQPNPPASPLPDISQTDETGLWVLVSSTGDLWFAYFDEPLPYAEYWDGYQRHNADRMSCLWENCTYTTVTYVYDDFNYWGFVSDPGTGDWDGYWLWHGGQLVPGRPLISNDPYSQYEGYSYVDEARLTYGMNVRNATNLVYTYQRHYTWVSLILNFFSSPP